LCIKYCFSKLSKLFFKSIKICLTGEYIGQDSCHRSQNVKINTKKECLEISVTKSLQSGGSGKTYISGKLKTIEGWTYGKFEIRAILPEGIK
jgi:beta-glucanase (GH16 family)